MLIERSAVVSYETVRRWALKFGAEYARRLKRKSQASEISGISIRSSSRSTARSVISGALSIRRLRARRDCANKPGHRGRATFVDTVACQARLPSQAHHNRQARFYAATKRKIMPNVESGREFPRPLTKAGASDARISIIVGIEGFRFDLLRPSQPFRSAPFTTLCPFHPSSSLESDGGVAIHRSRCLKLLSWSNCSQLMLM
jgi:hypothetical protein